MADMPEYIMDIIDQVGAFINTSDVETLAQLVDSSQVRSRPRSEIRAISNSTACFTVEQHPSESSRSYEVTDLQGPR